MLSICVPLFFYRRARFSSRFSSVLCVSADFFAVFPLSSAAQGANARACALRRNPLHTTGTRHAATLKKLRARSDREPDYIHILRCQEIASSVHAVLFQTQTVIFSREPRFPTCWQENVIDTGSNPHTTIACNNADRKLAAGNCR